MNFQSFLNPKEDVLNIINDFFVGESFDLNVKFIEPGCSNEIVECRVSN